jgi:integrase
MGFWEKHEAIDFSSLYERELHPKGSAHSVGGTLFIFWRSTLGMRAGEIWGLMPKDFSKDGHSIYVVRQYNRVSKKAFGPTKGKNHRHVPLNDNFERRALGSH